MARILLLLTRTPWRDFRPYDLQGPALLAAGHEIIYVANAPQAKPERAFKWILLSDRDSWLARRSGGLNLYCRIVSLECDFVQLCSLEQLPLGLALAARKRCRIVYDCREDMASALFERRRSFPMPIRRAIFRSVRFLEAIASHKLDGIITADPGVYDLFHAIPEERKHICFNTALLEQFRGDFRDLEKRDYDVAVLGSMSSLRSGTQDVLEAIRLLKREGLRVRLLLIGQPDGEMVEPVWGRVREYGLSEQVHCTGVVPHDQVPGILSNAKLGIVPLLDYPKFHRNIACKAFEYMACGMPTIASDLPPQHLFLDDETGLFYPPGDIDKLAEMIRALLINLPRSRQMGAAAREAVERRWNGEREQAKLRMFYHTLARLPPRFAQ